MRVLVMKGHITSLFIYFLRGLWEGGGVDVDSCNCICLTYIANTSH